MPSSVNKVIVLGRLGGDPELRYITDGTALCTFNLATSRTWKDKAGEKQERVDWHRITVWGKQGEACHSYLVKGQRAYVEGRQETNSWEDRDGNTRYTTSVVAKAVIFLDRPRSMPDEPDRRPPPDYGDDDIPF